MSKGTLEDAWRRFQSTPEYMREHGIPFSVVSTTTGEVLEQCHHDKIYIDDLGIESFARAVFPDILKAHEDPQFRAEFEEWRNNQPELPKRSKSRKRRRRR